MLSVFKQMKRIIWKEVSSSFSLFLPNSLRYNVCIYLSGEGGEQSDIQVTSCPDKNAGAQNVHLCQYVTFIEINRISLCRVMYKRIPNQTLFGRFVYLNSILIKALSFLNSSLSLSPAMGFGVYGSRRSYSMVQYSMVL